VLLLETREKSTISRCKEILFNESRGCITWRDHPSRVRGERNDRQERGSQSERDAPTICPRHVSRWRSRRERGCAAAGLHLSLTSLRVRLYITIDYCVAKRVCPLTPRRRILTFCISGEGRRPPVWLVKHTRCTESPTYETRASLLRSSRRVKWRVWRATVRVTFSKKRRRFKINSGIIKSTNSEIFLIQIN